MEFTIAKKVNTITAKLKKTKVAKKLAIKKKVFKAKVDMKKVDNQAVKNLQTAIEKLQPTKCKTIFLIINELAIKKCWSNKKAKRDEKPKDES